MGADGLVSVAGSGNALMSLVGDALELTPGAQLRGLTLELAPATMGTTVTLGSAGLATLDGIEVATLVVGGAAVPGGSVPVVSAGTITVAGTFDATAVEALELLATGRHDFPDQCRQHHFRPGFAVGLGGRAGGGEHDPGHRVRSAGCWRGQCLFVRAGRDAG